MHSRVRIVLFSAFILLSGALLGTALSGFAQAKEITYSDLLEKVKQGQVLDVKIERTNLLGHLKSSPNEQFHTTLPPGHENLLKELHFARVSFSIRDPQPNTAGVFLLNLAPAVLVCCVLIPPFWLIFGKAGFSPWWSLLILVPGVNLIAVYVVAFSKWKPRTS